MTHPRRIFLRTLAVSASAAFAVHLIDGPFSFVEPIKAAPIAADEFSALADAAFNRARQIGCVYADILIKGYRTGSVPVRTGYLASGTIGEPNQLGTAIQSERFRVQVRVIDSGAWGVAERASVNKGEISHLTAQAVALAQANASVTQRAVVFAPVAVFKERCVFHHQSDHLDALIKGQLASVLADDRAMNGNRGFAFRTEEIYFASTNGECSRTTRLFRL